MIQNQMFLFTQKRFKWLVGLLTILNVFFLIYRLLTEDAWIQPAQIFIIFQFVLVFAYFVFLATVTWFDSRISELAKRLDDQDKSIEPINNQQRQISEEINEIRALVVTQSRDLGISFTENQKDLLESIDKAKEDQLEAVAAFTNTIDKEIEKLGVDLETLETHKIPQYFRDLQTQHQESHSNLYNNLYNELDRLNSLYFGLQPKFPLPAMNEWAISPSFAAHLIELFLYEDNPFVVDIGSGLSTLLLAYGASKMPGKSTIVSLEHDPFYLKRTQSMLQHHGLEKYIDLRLATLCNHDIDGEQWQWYDIRDIDFNNISLICVDGPPGNIQSNSRYPAIPLLEPFMQQDVTVLLDDGQRAEEKAIADRWSTQFGFRKKYFQGDTKGYYELSRGSRG